MSDLDKNPRPPLPERHSRFLELRHLIEWIELLEIAYEETSNEKVYRVLKTLRSYRDNEITQEEAYRDEEIQEFWRNPGAFPESVRWWFMLYRDAEME